MSVAGDVKEVLAQMGRGSIGDIAEQLGIYEGDPRWHSVGQALSTGLGKWSDRVGRGEYVWLNGGKPAAPATPDELRPLVDSLDVEFGRVGLTFVARTQDGAFICTDQHGVAWRVDVTVTARLI
jgi:hypothetical protein